MTKTSNATVINIKSPPRICCDIGQTCIGKKDVKMTYFLE